MKKITMATSGLPKSSTKAGMGVGPVMTPVNMSQNSAGASRVVKPASIQRGYMSGQG